ncbi:hypothetical protein EJF18_80312 [Clavispora lusitaniae]|uniref:Uncharacterized protein n=1 Tax=Clavispora lusitaniae TaxID=36911 RepID=A0ACD0WST9_CLALS|nr:hypothetical protein EJF14_80312 [Clavispora lusitaniae]QFZ36251.1 hypothetical protein EJF16_80312 [Clavispora lusitaniae]QFZ41935.1 hypothetical protein EJF15_80312 [Clavispora lusitaniae]QFZ47611.1 hypothetical protein EJF18_80312 [Clavispora lusitaniae]QFZ53290.1 hypothetical protein EJF17_80312 [Clavispora lusitaniae]
MLRTNIFLLLAKSFHRAMRQRQLKCRELDVVAGSPKITVHVHERMWDTGISLEDNFVSVGQEFAGISLALVSHGITASGDDDGFWQVGEAGGSENVLEPAHLGHFSFSLRLILGKSVPLELVKVLDAGPVQRGRKLELSHRAKRRVSRRFTALDICHLWCSSQAENKRNLCVSGKMRHNKGYVSAHGNAADRNGFLVELQSSTVLVHILQRPKAVFDVGRILVVGNQAVIHIHHGNAGQAHVVAENVFLRFQVAQAAAAAVEIDMDRKNFVFRNIVGPVDSDLDRGAIKREESCLLDVLDFRILSCAVGVYLGVICSELDKINGLVGNVGHVSVVHFHKHRVHLWKNIGMDRVDCLMGLCHFEVATTSMGAGPLYIIWANSAPAGNGFPPAAFRGLRRMHDKLHARLSAENSQGLLYKIMPIPPKTFQNFRSTFPIAS